MNQRFQRYFRHATFWALVAYWLLLLGATHWPIPRPIKSAQMGDKIVHFVAYAVLACLLIVELWWRKRSSWRAYLAVFVGLAIFGGLDELTQPLVNRSADWFDWFADVAGIAVGLLVARVGTSLLERQMAPV